MSDFIKSPLKSLKNRGVRALKVISVENAHLNITNLGKTRRAIKGKLCTLPRENNPIQVNITNLGKENLRKSSLRRNITDLGHKQFL